MILKKFLTYFYLLIFLTGFKTTVLAQAETKPAGTNANLLKVNVAVLPPCVIKRKDGGYTGFDVELWEKIAVRLKLQFEYKETKFKEIIPNLSSSQADVGFACLTINKERETITDFSHQYMNSGLHIMVRNETNLSLFQTVKSLFSPIFLKSLLYFFLFIVICGHIFWLSERGENSINLSYFPGIFEAFWHILVTMTTVGYGDIVPKKWTSRIISAFVMLTGISFFGWVIAEFSSAITLHTLDTRITSPKDLNEKTVATLKGSTSIKTLEQVGAFVVQTKSIGESFVQLEKNKVDAVVFDAPSLLYHQIHEGKGKAKVVGKMFDLQDYGFAFPENSKLREQVNRILLRLKDNGEYDALYNKWFGKH
ncbi:MAG: transporter substrate-binding domain-containing protein [Spirochaetota bacterium]